LRYETISGAIEKEDSRTVEFKDGTIPDHAREMGTTEEMLRLLDLAAIKPSPL
jgi:hypothetical protein